MLGRPVRNADPVHRRRYQGGGQHEQVEELRDPGVSVDPRTVSVDRLAPRRRPPDRLRRPSEGLHRPSRPSPSTVSRLSVDPLAPRRRPSDRLRRPSRPSPSTVPTSRRRVAPRLRRPSDGLRRPSRPSPSTLGRSPSTLGPSPSTLRPVGGDAEQGLRRWSGDARTLHAAGVIMRAGTDSPLPGIFPGSSVHEEMRLLVEAGIPAGEVISGDWPATMQVTWPATGRPPSADGRPSWFMAARARDGSRSSGVRDIEARASAREALAQPLLWRSAPRR